MKMRWTRRPFVAAVACVGLGVALVACGDDGDDGGNGGNGDSPASEESDDSGAGSGEGGEGAAGSAGGCELISEEAVADATGVEQEVTAGDGGCAFAPSGVSVVSIEIGIDTGTYVEGLRALCDSSSEVDVEGADEAFTCDAFEVQGHAVAGSTLYTITVSEILAEEDIDTDEALDLVEELLPQLNLG